MLKSFKITQFACYVGYVVQAIIVNFLPLLYVYISSDYGISFEKITLLISVTFAFQLLIDFFSARFIEKIGYRKCIVTAHICVSIGFILLSFLPEVIPPFAGFTVAVLFYSFGAGLIEVLVSPIIEACPSDSKSGSMQLLHSFYCWGMVFTILVSTAFFAIFGIENWQYCALMWTVIPVVNTFLFLNCPINTLKTEGESGSIKKLFSNKIVWVVMILMLCSGAAEQAVAQWASAFVEAGLKISKTYSDLIGPCLFAVCMGIVRMLYGFFADKIKLKPALMASGVLCVISYLIIIFSPWAWLSLVGASLCGVSVAIMWPACLSLGAENVSGGGTSLFAYMALFGDAGCIVGPGLVGMIAGSKGIGVSLGFGIVFPILIIIGLMFFKSKKRVNA